jgi:hypothetical protein
MHWPGSVIGVAIRTDVNSVFVDALSDTVRLYGWMSAFAFILAARKTPPFRAGM